MSLLETVHITLTDEQVETYLAQVNEVLISRQRERSLLSTFDLISGAMIVLFAAGQAKKIPFAWFFAQIRPDVLPTGLLEKANELDRKMKELNDLLDGMEERADLFLSMHNDFDELREQVRGMTNQLRDAEKELLNA